MRSTAAIGIEFMSAASPTLGALATRRPSTRTRVRELPRPRRLAPENDCADEPDCGRNWPVVEKVDVRMNSAIVVEPLSSSCARVTTVTGRAPSAAARLIREPVTSTFCMDSATGASVVCAKADIALMARVTATAILVR